MKENKLVIISLGGSLIVPDLIDTNFLIEFRKIILSNASRFIMICGGGKTSRNYQEALKLTANPTKEDLDWMGIKGTILNANLVRIIFRDYSNPKIITNPTDKVEFNEKIIVASGWKPGFSTDYDAVMLAENFGVNKLINFTNIDYIYDKDPNKFEDAKPIKKISWSEFRKLLPDKWKPGLNTPFDPIAAKKAEELGLNVIVLNGKNLSNFENYLNGKEFVGTVIE